MEFVKQICALQDLAEIAIKMMDLACLMYYDLVTYQDIKSIIENHDQIRQGSINFDVVINLLIKWSKDLDEDIIMKYGHMWFLSDMNLNPYIPYIVKNGPFPDYALHKYLEVLWGIDPIRCIDAALPLGSRLFYRITKFSIAKTVFDIMLLKIEGFLTNEPELVGNILECQMHNLNPCQLRFMRRVNYIKDRHMYLIPWYLKKYVE
jgi:hypothetical protein